MIGRKVAYLPGVLPASAAPPDHEDHPVAIYPGGVRVCVEHQQLEYCLCGGAIIAEEGFEGDAVRAHQQTDRHRVWCRSRYGGHAE